MYAATALLALALVASASAFTAPVAARARTSTVQRRALSDLEGYGPEAGPFTEPFGQAYSYPASDELLGWYRHAEIKHGRVAMFASVGWIVQTLGLHLPGYISPSAGVTFAKLSEAHYPLDQWALVPDAGKWQIALVALLVEFHSELTVDGSKYFSGPHYTKDISKAGRIQVPGFWDPIGLWKNTNDAKKKRGRIVELNNGRLAMVGMASFLAAANMEGTVPALGSFFH